MDTLRFAIGCALTVGGGVLLVVAAVDFWRSWCRTPGR